MRVTGPSTVSGTVTVPGDKSVSHRALLLAALAPGTSRITGLSNGADVVHTAAAIVTLGATLTTLDERTVEVTGGALHEPAAVIDTGNSGTGIRLIAGLAAGLNGLTVLQGDASIARRPMDRIAVPLRLMGAVVDGREGGRLPPISIRGGDLRGIDYAAPVSSAQVKSAILLAGLRAAGETIVREPVRSRAHTEEMLTVRGADLDVDGATVRLRPSQLTAVDEAVPGDPSQAAFWLVGAAALAGSDVTVEGIYLGHARGGFLDVLRRMGADVTVTESASVPRAWDVRVRAGELRGTDIEEHEIAGLVDEVPALAVAAALAHGVTTVRGAAELRVKESDRVATTAAMLRAFGTEVEELPDGLVITGGARLHPGRVDSHGDHRIAMAASILALAADGPSEIIGFEAVATSYPGFLQTLDSVTVDSVASGDPVGD
ncbi:3-phosphoshikimate 1-carboxyvinyltransferase [Jatrophihabitans sp.]|uniref:3-phosphoshikimate 1-carboxyvinyltransferase n=1 Tax=Jatrophihabitans sp. TaxID=1932789 RepID=UPI0030C76632